MMGNESIDLSLITIWQSWFEFRKGKRMSAEFHKFQYSLEKNLLQLCDDLNSGQYRHSGYKKFIVNDNKRREISVASIRDRVVHRLIYDYLNGVYDKTFIDDVWSCRTGKGLLGAIERAQELLKKLPAHYIWKVDVHKFFDSVDQQTLLTILARKISDEKPFRLLEEVITSYRLDRSKMGGGRSTYR